MRGISAHGLHATRYAVISENRVTGFNEGIVVGHRKTGAYPLTPNLFNNVLVDNQVGVYVMRSKNPAYLTNVTLPTTLAVLVRVAHSTFYNNEVGLRVQPEFIRGNGVSVSVDVVNSILASSTPRVDAVNPISTGGRNNVFYNYTNPPAAAQGGFGTTLGNTFGSDPQLLTRPSDPRRYALPVGSPFCTGGRLDTNANPVAPYTPIDILGAARPSSPSRGAFQCL